LILAYGQGFNNGNRTYFPNFWIFIVKKSILGFLSFILYNNK